uniref:Uncharacterized protein n=1 Tax=viral metagenome TaxID=1070528 RepID=A0A6C0JQG7_9ZZZZ
MNTLEKEISSLTLDLHYDTNILEIVYENRLFSKAKVVVEGITYLVKVTNDHF